MTSYIAITNSEVQPEAPITSELMTKLRDNPIAIAEGASGAPKIDPINAMAHLGAVGAIGTYAILYKTTTGVVSPGTLVAGSSLRYSNTFTDTYYVPGEGMGSYTSVYAGGTVAPPGTWRLMGHILSDTPLHRASLWLRIS